MNIGSSSETEPEVELGSDQGSSSKERREPCDNTFILEECPCSRSPEDNPLNRAYIKNSGLDKFNNIYRRAISYLEEYKSRHVGESSNSVLRADVKDRDRRYETILLKRKDQKITYGLSSIIIKWVFN